MSQSTGASAPLVTVELYGLLRHRAGVDSVQVPGACLADVLRHLEARFPQLRPAYVDNGHLAGGLLASINGRRFTSRGETPLEPGDCVLLVTADAGG
jgi:molybdopterin converting factor small subunit